MAVTFRRWKLVLPFYFALGSPLNKYSHSKLLVRLYNGIFMLFTVFCLVVSHLQFENDLFSPSYKYLMRASVVIHLYVTTAYWMYLSYSFSKSNKTYQHINNLYSIHSRLEKFCTDDIKSPLPNFNEIVLFAMFISMPICALIYVLNGYWNVFFLWSVFMPAFVINLFILITVSAMVLLIRTLNKIKHYLTSLIEENDLSLENHLFCAIYQSNMPENRRKLENLYEIMAIYYDLWKNTRLFNDLYGNKYVIFFCISLTLVICTSYFNFLRYYQTPDEFLSFHVILMAYNYWCVIYSCSNVSLCFYSTIVSNRSTEIRRLLYRLNDFYPHLRDDIAIHGYQLQHQKLQIMAGNLFVLRFNLIGSCFIVILTYLLVLIQIDFDW